jgi:hypothetical protein
MSAGNASDHAALIERLRESHHVCMARSALSWVLKCRCGWIVDAGTTNHDEAVKISEAHARSHNGMDEAATALAEYDSMRQALIAELDGHNEMLCNCPLGQKFRAIIEGGGKVHPVPSEWIAMHIEGQHPLGVKGCTASTVARHCEAGGSHVTHTFFDGQYLCPGTGGVHE